MRTGMQRKRAAAFVAAFLCLVVFAFLPATGAYAEGGVSLVGLGAGMGGLEAVNPAPATAYTVTLDFDKNVSYAQGGDSAFVELNLSKVHIEDAAGNRVEAVRVYGASGQDDRYVIYVASTDWLAPLSTYTVVAEAGIVAQNGEDRTAVEYRANFKTGPECANGLTVYQNAVLIICPIVLVAGAVIAVMRRRRLA